MNRLFMSTILICHALTFGMPLNVFFATSPLAPDTTPVELMRIVDEPAVIQALHATAPITTATLAPTTEPSLRFLGSGYAAHYGKTVMARVARNRGMAPSDCMLSYTEATDADLGSYILVESQIDGDALWCQIMDMPQPYDYRSIKGRKIIVELDFYSATVLCNITQVAQEPPRACPVNVYR